MLRIPAQRASATDKNGQVSAPWWQFFSDMARTVNAKRFTASATEYSHTGTTDETTAATIPVVIGSTGIAKLVVMLTMTANANAKTVKVKIGASTVQTITLDNAGNAAFSVTIIGTGASTQITLADSLTNCTTAGPVETTETINQAIDLSVTVQLATITDNITVKAYTLTVEQS
jgi:hypothetical protein